LTHDPTPFEEGEIKHEEPATLAALDRPHADSLNDRIHKTFIHTYQLRPWSDLRSWERRRRELVRELKNQVFRAFPSVREPFAIWKAKDDGWISRYADASEVEFSTEEGVRLTARLSVPRTGKTSYPALIYVKGSEDVVYSIDDDPLLPVMGSHVVLVLNPRAVDYPADNYKMATLRRTAALIGASIESMQVWDLLRSIDYLADAEHLTLSSVSV